MYRRQELETRQPKTPFEQWIAVYGDKILPQGVQVLRQIVRLKECPVLLRRDFLSFLCLILAALLGGR